MRARAIVATVVALAGCDSIFDIEHIDKPPIDAPNLVDAACYGTGLISLCLDTELEPILELTTGFDTSSDGRCMKISQTSGPEMCVLAATRITVTEIVSVTGSRPLVLVAADSAEIVRTLDVASKVSGRIGAGAQTGCPSNNGANGTTGAGGGGGGSFAFTGGGGGPGGGAAGGAPGPVVDQTGVFGGCAGGNGGITGTIAAAAGGAGGGAVYVIAGRSITVPGAINSSGAGGRGGAPTGGGGGGGAGGLIALDAPTIAIDGQVFARGGGGGGGGGSAAAGNPGADPTQAMYAVPGGGAGTGGTSGGDGCNGTVGGIVVGAPPVNGGGGGGGGCGVIRIYGTRTGSGVLNPVPI